MVQRKDPNKLGIQDNRINSEIWLANLKPFSLQYQDIKINKGEDLKKKKKMKKSGLTKSIEFENYRSPKLPNYMKSTSSSVARKEQSHVSATTSPSTRHHVTSDLHGKNLNKATKTLVRTNSLKMKRTLIKTPGFKPGRALVKNCSKIVLSDDFDIARATCSSTLKDYKLPDYLVLTPGGTESEGTSRIKVCRYTYCSLNGHLHHHPLPSLKSFVSAKRLMLKSPRRVRPAGDDVKSDEKHVNDSVLCASTVCPLALKEPREFFVEIYTAGEKITSNTDITLPMVCGRDEVVVQDYEEVEEAVSDGDDISFQEILDEGRGEEGSIDTYLEAKIPEEISLPTSFQEETKLGNLSFWDGFATESMPSIQQYEHESSDMDWETGHYSALYLAFDYEVPSEGEKGHDLDGFQDENRIIHDGIISFFDANDMSQYTYSDDGLSSDSVSIKDDCTSEVSVHCLDGSNSMKTPAAIEFPEEDQPEAIYENKDLSFEGNKTPEKIAHIVSATEAPSNLMIGEENSFDCLNFECLLNEDSTAGTGKGKAELLKDVVQEMVTSADKAISDTIIDVDASIQTSSNEGQENLESSIVIVQQTKDDSSESPTKPDQAAAPSKVGRGILKKNVVCLQDQLTGEGFSITIAKCKKSMEENDEEGLFNPREPNFLPLEPEPEAEKVDLRHQELDEKKNAEEWMVDYALRQTVTKLSPDRKKRVALLVEAFEKVMPITKYELNQSHGSGFEHARPVQACN